MDIVKFVVLNTQFVEVVVARLVFGFAFVVLDGTIIDQAFVKEKSKVQIFALVFVLQQTFLFMQPSYSAVYHNVFIFRWY